MCAGMWRAKGLRLGAAGVRRGQGGGRDGTVPSGKRVPHSLSVTHTALRQMLTSNYLGSRYIVPTGKTTFVV